MPTSTRPLSPHLQVYRPQLTSVLSITHRATGIFLSFGAVALVWWLAALAAGPEHFLAVQQLAEAWYGRLLLFAWTLAFYYHLGNGIRHLVWDTGRGFELEQIYRSGYAVLVAAVVLTIVTWAAALAGGGA